MYIFLTLCTLFSFFWFQKQVVNKKKYFVYSTIPLLLYCVTYGLRKGWGQDYDVYDALFLGDFRLGLENYEVLFRFIIITLQSVSDSSSILFIFIAAATIFSYIFLFFPT